MEVEDELAQGRKDAYDEAYDNIEEPEDLADAVRARRGGYAPGQQWISIARAFVVWRVCVGERGAERPFSVAFGAGQQTNPVDPVYIPRGPRDRGYRYHFQRSRMRDNLQGITAAAVRRLARKAGVRRVPDDPNFYKEVRARPPHNHDRDGSRGPCGCIITMTTCGWSTECHRSS